MLDLFDHSLRRCPTPNTSLIFSDESSQNKRFFVLGALYFWLPSGDYKSHVAKIENKFTDLKAQYGIGTPKWEKIPEPGPRLEGYKALVRYLAAFSDPKIRFKCMVVDTDAYPLDHPTINKGDSLDGYLRYYTVFLTDGIMLTQRGYFYDITMDNYTFRPRAEYDLRALGKYVECRYVRKSKKAYLKQQHSQLAVAEEEDSNLLQMVDILAGAVAFCRSGGMLRDSVRSVGMKEMVHVVQESYGGVRLNRPQDRGPFVIWNFIDRKEPGPSLTARSEVSHFP